MFERVDPRAQHDELVEVHLEYFSWVAERFEALYGLSIPGIVGAPLQAVVDRMVRGLANRGALDVFYLLKLGDRTAGMGGLHDLADDAVEMVKIFVRPEFRGARLGEALVDRLLEDARAAGFGQIRLSSARFMIPAHRIYEARGFADRSPYEGAGVPAPMVPFVRFMERSL